MRWTLLILIGICTASATWMNTNRMGQKMQRAGDSDDDDLDSVPDYDWNDDDDDMEDMMDEDRMYRDRQRGPSKPYYPHPRQQQHKGQPSMEEWDEDDTQFGLPYPQRQQKRKEVREDDDDMQFGFPYKQQQQQRKQVREDDDDMQFGFPYKQQQQQQRKQVREDDEDGMQFGFPYQQRQQKRKEVREQQTCHTSKCPMQKKSVQFDMDDFQMDTEEEDEYERLREIRMKIQKQREQQKKQRLLHGEEEEETGECRPSYDAMPNLVQVNAQLASKLHKEAKEQNDDKNTVVSPVALQLLLAALKEGAKGETKTQIGHVLNSGTMRHQDRNAHVALAKSLKGQGPEHGGSKSANVKCSINIIFRQQSAQEQFVHAIKNCFDAEVKRCDFKKQPHRCREQINKWLMGKQDQKLQSILDRNSITANTEMVSIGTMQVKANWDRQLKKTLKIVKGKFNPLGDDKSVTVKMIQTNGEFNHFEDDQMEMLGIQTQDNLLTLYIILPKDHHGLNELEKHRLQYGKQLQEIIQRADKAKQTLKVQLPIFQIVHKMETKNMLRKLGTVNPFDLDDADFSGISDDQQDTPVLKYGKRHIGGLEDVLGKKDKASLHVNQLLQQATIQINENGIDVANGQFQHQMGGEKHEEGTNVDQNKQEDTRGKANQFRVDHAFAFIIKHNPSNQLVMMGRVVDPTEEYEQEKHQNRRDIEEEE